LVEAVRVRARYDLAEENGETRREKYERMKQPCPTFEIPEGGLYLWTWFFQLNNAIHRVDFNGYYTLMPPSEILAWIKLTKNLITPLEYDILNSMDAVFCSELNKETKAKRDKDDERRKREIEAERSRARARRR